MTKGKYASRAAAGQARRETEAQLATLTREHSTLLKKYDELLAEHSDLKRRHGEQVGELRQRVDEATTPELERLRYLSESFHEAVANERQKMREVVVEFFRQSGNEVRMSTAAWVSLEKILDARMGEILDLSGYGTGNRTARRARASSLRERESLSREAQGHGFNMKGLA